MSGRGRASGFHPHATQGPTPRELEREAARAARTREEASREKERRRIAQRIDDAARATDLLDSRVRELSTLLVRGLRRSAHIDLDERRLRWQHSQVGLGADEYSTAPPQWEEFVPPRPSAIARAFGATSRHEERLREAEQRFAAAQQHHGQEETSRQLRVRQRREAHASTIAQALEAINGWQAGMAARDRPHVERYLSEVLENVPRPTGFPHQVEVTFDPVDDHAVIQIELPGPEVVPMERAVQYIRPPRDETVPKQRPERERAELYRLIVAQVCLLVLRDLFQADAALARVSLNAHVWRTNRATGGREYPCLISVIVERTEFETLVLSEVTPTDCLRHLKALVSPHPYEVEAVRPLVDFDRSRYAFTEGIDVVAGLDSRDDLITLTPTEFEHLVRQLFEALPGMQGWTTQASGDDGVDAVIFNDTPITGGLTVVQAKRYRASVGVAHVRELAGAMEDKKAGHGVLVTTSTFTKGAMELSRRLQRIELIDKHHLVHLLKEHLNKDVVVGTTPGRSR